MLGHFDRFFKVLFKPFLGAAWKEMQNIGSLVLEELWSSHAFTGEVTLHEKVPY